MKFKPDVRLAGIQPVTALAMPLLEPIFAAFGIEYVVTAVVDGTHMRRSKHYEGLAWDSRLRTLAEARRPELVAACRTVLTPEFQLIYETDLFDQTGRQTRWAHLHTEFDPRS